DSSGSVCVPICEVSELIGSLAGSRFRFVEFRVYWWFAFLPRFPRLRVARIRSLPLPYRTERLFIYLVCEMAERTVIRVQLHEWGKLPPADLFNAIAPRRERTPRR